MIWFVAFHPRQPHHWWARTYGHVSLMGHERETWLHLDLGRDGVETSIFHQYDEVQDFLSYMTAYHTIVRAPELPKARAHFLRPLTCVAMVKHTLGLPSCALLPDQLFTTLTLKYSAEVMNATVPATSGNRRAEAAARPS
jgi:hypothetical protein